MVGLLVRAEYLPYGVRGWTALAEVVAEDQSAGFRKKEAIKKAQQVCLTKKREKARNRFANEYLT